MGRASGSVPDLPRQRRPADALIPGDDGGDAGRGRRRSASPTRGPGCWTRPRAAAGSGAAIWPPPGYMTGSDDDPADPVVALASGNYIGARADGAAERGRAGRRPRRGPRPGRGLRPLAADRDRGLSASSPRRAARRGAKPRRLALQGRARAGPRRSRRSASESSPSTRSPTRRGRPPGDQLASDRTGRSRCSSGRAPVRGACGGCGSRSDEPSAACWRGGSGTPCPRRRWPRPSRSWCAARATDAQRGRRAGRYGPGRPSAVAGRRGRSVVRRGRVVVVGVVVEVVVGGGRLVVVAVGVIVELGRRGRGRAVPGVGGDHGERDPEADHDGDQHRDRPFHPAAHPALRRLAAGRPRRISGLWPMWRVGSSCISGRV